ncbi:MAG: hypothetical protein KF862_14880 [Chitinophagaceae bacterium]|nr:hypothetical protein [Chitinophagaceae bacterium]
MKNYILSVLSLLMLLFANSCKKEEIYVYNTQNTPDLSNPIIEKMTNILWYRGGLTTTEAWATQNNFYKPAEYASSLLYQAAWANFILYRDGTSNMVFTPPFAQNAVIHCKGNWEVSKEEENTIIIATKTPVTSVTGKIKILDMEAKDNLIRAKISIDFGDRLLELGLINESTYEHQSPAMISGLDPEWVNQQTILKDPLKADDFTGAWKNGIDYDSQTEQMPLENLVRYTYIEDLLAHTPMFLNGLVFNLQNNGKAQIVYPSTYNWDLKMDQNIKIISEGKWSVKGNKMLLETDEELFMTIGEGLFNFKPHLPGLQLLGYGERSNSAYRILPKRFYSFEIIRRTDIGFWTRVTTNTEVFYTFMSKTQFDGSNTLNVKQLF